MAKIVIIGGSIAGYSAAVELRKLDKDCLITVLSDEEYLAYDRRKLPDFFAGTVPEQELYLAGEEFYKDQSITFLKNKKATSVNPGKRIVHCKDKENFSYDYLVVASGQKVGLPEIPGARKNGVLALGALADYKELLNRVIMGTVCVVGSDESALCVAKAFVSKYQVEVKLISRNRFDDSLNISEIEIIYLPLEEIIGEGQVQAIKVKSGKVIGVSLVIFMDEWKKNIEFLKNQEIEITAEGLRVDEQMRTSQENIFACGAVIAGKEAKTQDDIQIQARAVAESIISNIKKGEACQTSSFN